MNMLDCKSFAVSAGIEEGSALSRDGARITLPSATGVILFRESRVTSEQRVQAVRARFLSESAHSRCFT